MTGTAEERKAVLESLDPEKRRQVLASLPPNVLEHTRNSRRKAKKPARCSRRKCRRKTAGAIRS